MVVVWCGLLAVRLLFGTPFSVADATFVVSLAAFQNVVLGWRSPSLTPDLVRILIGTNFMLGVIWLGGLCLVRVRRLLRPDTLAVMLGPLAITLLAAASLGAFGFHGLAAVASFRNITTPFLFLAIGWLLRAPGAGSHAERDFMRAIVAIGMIVIALGVLERFAVPDAWHGLHVGALWTQKGLTNVTSGGLPRNWWSAERVGGEPVRRLVSTFADPVNLGTFLFLVVTAAYGLRRPFAGTLAVIALVLTVSKGGALGCLVFLTVFAYYRWSTVSFVLSCTVAAAAGTGFIFYSIKHATGSLYTHVGGAAFALLSLPEYPLGRGLGRAGTMAQQFQDLGSQQILESGLGVIVGQLGFPGLAVFLILLGIVYRRLLRLDDVRQRVVAVTLFWSIALNITFNEVALSPNSNAGYFILLGLMGSRAPATRKGHRLA